MKCLLITLLVASGILGALGLLGTKVTKLNAEVPNILYLGQVKDLSVYWLARGNCMLVVYQYRGDVFQLRCGR